MSVSGDKLDEATSVAFTSRVSRLLSVARGLLKGKDRNRLIATQVFNAVLGLVTGKLIATYIDPTELGAYNLQFGAFTFFSGLFISPLLQFKKASYQGYLDQHGYRNFNRSFSMYAGIMLAACIAFFSIYREGEFLTASFVLILTLLIPITYFNGFVTDQFNILGNLKIFSIQSVLNNVAGALFIFAMCLTAPSSGYLTLWGMQIVMAVTGLLFFGHRIVRYHAAHPEAFSVFLRKQAKFIAPLVILAFFSWISSYFDRYIIEANLGLDKVGIYNVNYGLGSKFFLMLNPIFLVMLTPYVFQPNPIREKKTAIVKYLRIYLAGGLALTALIFLFSDLIGTILLSEKYAEGFFLIYCTAFSTMILTATYLLETLFYAEHRTATILYSNVIAAVLSIVLNLIFTPLYGMPGAIAASIVAYTGKMIYTLFIFRKL